jgi:tetratricopeptide (TPR) repeat protein
MGQFGLGIKSLIRSRRPKKLFSKEKDSTGDTIPKYSRKFNLVPRSKKSFPKLKPYVTLVSLILISFFSIYLIRDYRTSETKHQKIVRERISEEKNEAFDLFLKYGISHFDKNDWESAKKEFEQAIKLSPENYELNKYYIQTLLNLYSGAELEQVLDRIDLILESHPEDDYLSRLKVQCYFQMGDTINAIAELERIENNN